jgi:uncharacterized membrane protein YhaH (DUF805 family)
MNNDNLSEKLINLIKLQKEGKISAEEFNHLKKDILNKQLSGRPSEPNTIFTPNKLEAAAELPTFITDLQYCFKNVANISGRCPKRPYTNFVGLYILFNLISVFFYQKETWTALDTLYTLGAVVIVFVFCSVAIKRLHDANYSGWWSLVYIASQILIISEAASGKDNSDLSIIALIFSLIFIVVLYFIKGSPGPNSYGEQINRI